MSLGLSLFAAGNTALRIGVKIQSHGPRVSKLHQEAGIG
jgi:hypothetical protein